MALPSEWREIERPGREDITLYVSGDGSSWEYVGQLKHGDPIAPTDCTGLTCEAEIRSDGDDAVMSLGASFTSEATGVFKLTASNSSVIALLPSDAPPKGARIKIGRWQFAVNDGTDRFVLMSGDVWGLR